MHENIAIWSIWFRLPEPLRLYWLLLSAAVFYVLRSSVSILRATQRPESSVCQLETRVSNLRQVIAGAFFAFGAVFSYALPEAFRPFGDSNRSILEDIFDDFTFQFACAANVFFVLLALHCVQWIVSVRVFNRRTL